MTLSTMAAYFRAYSTLGYSSRAKAMSYGRGATEGSRKYLRTTRRPLRKAPRPAATVWLSQGLISSFYSRLGVLPTLSHVFCLTGHSAATTATATTAIFFLRAIRDRTDGALVFLDNPQSSHALLSPFFLLCLLRLLCRLISCLCAFPPSVTESRHPQKLAPLPLSQPCTGSVSRSRSL